MQVPNSLILRKGNVLYGRIFEGIDHSKFFVVLGEDKNHNLIGFFFINTERDIFKKAKDLLFPVKSADYSFLTHISFIDCSEIKKISSKYIEHKIEDGIIELKGALKEEHLSAILETLRSSDVFSEEEKDLYLK